MKWAANTLKAQHQIRSLSNIFLRWDKERPAQSFRLLHVRTKIQHMRHQNELFWFNYSAHENACVYTDLFTCACICTCIHMHCLLELCDKRWSSGKLDSVRVHRPRKRGTDLEELAYFISLLSIMFNHNLLSPSHFPKGIEG